MGTIMMKKSCPKCGSHEIAVWLTKAKCYHCNHEWIPRKMGVAKKTHRKHK